MNGVDLRLRHRAALDRIGAACNRQYVTGVNRLQVRPRGVAAIMALVLVVCGILAMHHEASTAHIRDAAGGYAHGRQLDGHHAGGNSDIHGQRDPDSETGDCAVLSAFHQAASAAFDIPALTITQGALCVLDAPCHVTMRVATAVYRLAPKTSPPSAV